MYQLATKQGGNADVNKKARALVFQGSSGVILSQGWFTEESNHFSLGSSCSRRVFSYAKSRRWLVADCEVLR